MGIREKLWYVPYCPESMETGVHHWHRQKGTSTWKCEFCPAVKYFPVSMPDAEAYQNMLHKLGYETTQAVLLGPGSARALREFKSKIGITLEREV